MGTLFDYLNWRGDLTFDQAPFNGVDGLICATLAYVHYDGLVSEDFQDPTPLGAVAAVFDTLEDKEARVLLKNDGPLLLAAAQTARYRDLGMVFYRNEVEPELESQFSAVAFLLPGGETAVLAFRGTDATLVGWKEDFNMSFQDQVPAQEKALYYTQSFARVHSQALILCGHSKGGNLAVYAASRCPEEIQRRILGVYNNDGPGFSPLLMADPGYAAMVPKIHSYVPESAVIGMLLEHQEPYTVVKSRQVSILQHDPYSWRVSGPGFVPVEEVSADSRFLNRTIRTWLAGKTRKERNEFVDAVYGLLTTGEVDSTRQLMLPWNILRYLHTLNEDAQMRKVITREIGDLIRTAGELMKQKEAPALGDH